MKKVLIVMGSDSDLKVVKNAVDVLEEFGISYQVRISSAHRAPKETEALATTALENGFGVILAAAGGAAHLAGVIAANTPLPVVAIPIKNGALSGVDALYAMVQMPAGIPVATVAIDGARNAGILAVQILAVQNADLMAKMVAFKTKMNQGVVAKDQKLQQLGVGDYLAQMG